jgi:MaoC like domain/short chain dehydrogenase
MSFAQAVSSRKVSESLQQQFAALCGDRNPIHTDSVAARRTQAGRPVVHGIHTLLWALDSLVSLGLIVSPVTRVKAKFLKWVYLDDTADLGLPLGITADPQRLQVEVLGMTVLTADLTYETQVLRESNMTLDSSPASPMSAAANLSFAELAGRSGKAFTAEAEDVAVLFPCLSKAITGTAVAEVAACSYVVGMEVPGLYSMFSALDLTIDRVTNATSPRAALHYRIIKRDERFRKTQVEVVGRSVSGFLEAFMRTPPVEQASMQTVAAHVETSEFKGMHALIVGGSRGLGELTAKLIAAGGGSSTITYSVGKADAERLAQQILDAGRKVKVMHYDVHLTPETQFAEMTDLTDRFTHLFYFATNAIFQPKGRLVSPSILTAFTAFYLQGFHDLCMELMRPGKSYSSEGKDLFVYYPSSVAVEERPIGMTEYAMIKAAGEQMCHDMNQYVRGLHILTTRLPRLHTDQTASVVPEQTVDPITVLLPIVREMRNLSLSSRS